MAKLFVEPAKNSENKCPIKDWLPHVGQCVGHGLQATTVIRDEQITFDEGAELSVEIHDTCFLVANKLLQCSLRVSQTCQAVVLVIMTSSTKSEEIGIKP